MAQFPTCRRPSIALLILSAAPTFFLLTSDPKVGLTSELCRTYLGGWGAMAAARLTGMAGRIVSLDGTGRTGGDAVT